MIPKYKINKALKLLGIDQIKEEDKSIVLEYVLNYLIKNEQSKGQKTFDIYYDYKYYYVDFLKLGIDLNKDNITWWEFDSILEGIFLQKESTIGQVLEYRLYKRPSKNVKMLEEEEHKFKMQMKRKYALPNLKQDNKGFEKLWSYAEQKVGVNKEV